MSDRHPSEERLMAFLEGALSVEEQAHLEQHLELCSRCSLERDQLSAVIQSIPSLRVDEKEVRAARASLQKALDEPTVMIPRWVPLSLAAGLLLGLRLLWGVAAHPEGFEIVESIQNRMPAMTWERSELDSWAPQLPESLR